MERRSVTISDRRQEEQDHNRGGFLREEKIIGHRWYVRRTAISKCKYLCQFICTVREATGLLPGQISIQVLAPIAGCLIWNFKNGTAFIHASVGPRASCGAGILNTRHFWKSCGWSLCDGRATLKTHSILNVFGTLPEIRALIFCKCLLVTL